MAIAPFLKKKEDREKQNPQNMGKKIDFSQKLSDEDLEDNTSQKPGKLDFIKGLRRKKEVNPVATTMPAEQPPLADSPVLEDRKEGEAVATVHPEPAPSKENQAAKKRGKDAEKSAGDNQAAEEKGQKEEEEAPKKGWRGYFAKRKKKDHVEEVKKPSWMLEVNLVRGEIIKFFDWQKGVMLLLVYVFAALTVLSLIYWGISWWGSSQQSVENITNIQGYYRANKEIKDLNPQVNDILKFKNKLDSVNFLLVRHIYWTNFFNFLEDNTLSNVYFLSFSGDIKGNYILKATTDKVDAVDAQIKKLLVNPYIKKAEVNSTVVDSKSGKTSISFSLSLTLDPNIFLK